MSDVTNQQLQKMLQRFPQTAKVVLSYRGRDYSVDRLEIVLPSNLPLAVESNLTWSELIADAIQVRIVARPNAIAEEVATLLPPQDRLIEEER
jgi:hypothetical protein